MNKLIETELKEVGYITFHKSLLDFITILPDNHYFNYDTLKKNKIDNIEEFIQKIMNSGYKTIKINV